MLVAARAVSVGDLVEHGFTENSFGSFRVATAARSRFGDSSMALVVRSNGFAVIVLR
jgi:hypothetical protein